MKKKFLLVKKLKNTESAQFCNEKTQEVNQSCEVLHFHKGGAWQIANSFPISTEHAY